MSEEAESQDLGAARLKANVIGPWGLAVLVIGVTSPANGLCHVGANLRRANCPILLRGEKRMPPDLSLAAKLSAIARGGNALALSQFYGDDYAGMFTRSPLDRKSVV